MHFKISILSTNSFMAIYEILFNVDSIQALQCEIFSYVYELNLYSVYSWQIIILLELSRHPIELSIKGAGGGPRPKIIFNVIFVEGRQSYQILFTGSKNIDPSRIYRIFKIAEYIQLPCGRTLYSRLSQNFKF